MYIYLYVVNELQISHVMQSLEALQYHVCIRREYNYCTATEPNRTAATAGTTPLSRLVPARCTCCPNQLKLYLYVYIHGLELGIFGGLITLACSSILSSSLLDNQLGDALPCFDLNNDSSQPTVLPQ